MIKSRFCSDMRSFIVQEKSMRVRNLWVGALGFTLALSLIACGSKEPSAPAESSTATAGGQKVDTATAGDVNGVVAFDGVAPKNEPIKMNPDPVCVKQNTTPQAAVGVPRPDPGPETGGSGGANGGPP